MPVDVAAQQIPLDVVIAIWSRGVGRHHDLETIVLGNWVVMVGVPRRDMGVLTNMRDVNVLIIPEHLRDGLFFGSLLEPREAKGPKARRGYPGRLVESAVHGNGRSGAVDFVARQVPRRGGV